MKLDNKMISMIKNLLFFYTKKKNSTPLTKVI